MAHAVKESEVVASGLFPASTAGIDGMEIVV
jgi:hypothetical protein